MLLTALGSFGILTPNAEAAAPTEFYVEATGHTLGGEFLQYWIDNNGQVALGNPVSEPRLATIGTVQYFQLGVLVSRANDDVAREQAAEALLAAQSHPGDQLFREMQVDPAPSVISEIQSIRTLSAIGSGHPFPVDASIRDFYIASGGRDTLGRALAPAETSGPVTRQWFEYARIELSASGPTLAPVGLELATARGIDTARVARGDLTAFNPNRYVDFAGDGTIPNSEGSFIPARIQIPSIDVDAAIEPVSVVGGVMQVPADEWNVGWYPSMSSPGEWSNVVMAGHKDWWGVGPVVFWNLDKLKSGDKIYVVGPDGAGATYEVTLSWLIDSKQPADPLIADTGYEALTLITCDGQWNGHEYTSRRIIRAVRI